MDDELLETEVWPRHDHTPAIRKLVDKASSVFLLLGQPLTPVALKDRPLKTMLRSCRELQINVKDCEHQMLITKTTELVVSLEAALVLVNCKAGYDKVDSVVNIRALGSAVRATRPFFDKYRITPAPELQIYEVTIPIAKQFGVFLCFVCVCVCVLSFFDVVPEPLGIGVTSETCNSPALFGIRVVCHRFPADSKPSKLRGVAVSKTHSFKASLSESPKGQKFRSFNL